MFLGDALMLRTRMQQTRPPSEITTLAQARLEETMKTNSSARACCNWIAALLIVSQTPVLASEMVTDEELRGAAANASEWLIYGRTYDNQRFSPLVQITPENVSGLQPVWAFSLGNVDGVEATPLIDNGVIFISGAHAAVYALDARIGRRLWEYRPAEPEGLGTVLCCGPVNRGVALWGDMVYVLTLDARLVALHRDNGAVVWEKTIGDWQQGYSATGAPYVVKDKIIVGVAGGEYGVRGYIKAFDAKRGDELWTTYTIPATGEAGNDTWPGDSWKTGGGPTWQSGSYDPELNLLYWGTGNPGPWVPDLRAGDNLYTCSLLAIDPDTGAINWHFQYTPNDGWDYDGNNAPILADITVNGQPVKAALQSNRNGFFYVLDRTNGKFVYAEPTIDGINWTTGIDEKTGRPSINEAMKPKSDGKTVLPIVPGLEGGTNWFPMAFNPELGYAFVPVNQWAMALTSHKKEDIVYKPGQVFMGMDYKMHRQGDSVGHLKAFDVANRKWVWDVASPLPLFAGVLATKSGLVFTGDQLGFFSATDAKSGKVLWRFQTGSGINASPSTYEIDGKQYVAILSGLGGDPSFYYQGPKGGTLWVFGLESISASSAYEAPWSGHVVPVEGGLTPVPSQ
jgi:alcohol dehydrogenase (cytochrome c)